jgi:hypothetical protein
VTRPAHRPVTEIAGIPRWMSLLGITATVLPKRNNDAVTGPVLIIGSITGAVAVPLNTERVS